jgi:hypothetical protein
MRLRTAKARKVLSLLTAKFRDDGVRWRHFLSHRRSLARSVAAQVQAVDHHPCACARACVCKPPCADVSGR